MELMKKLLEMHTAHRLRTRYGQHWRKQLLPHAAGTLVPASAPKVAPVGHCEVCGAAIGTEATHCNLHRPHPYANRTVARRPIHPPTDDTQDTPTLCATKPLL